MVGSSGECECPVCRYALTDREAYCPDCNWKLAYCTEPGCNYAGVAGTAFCPVHGTHLQVKGRSWTQKFADSGNTCYMPESTGLCGGGAMTLTIRPRSEQKYSSATCDGTWLYTTDERGRPLRMDFDAKDRRLFDWLGVAPLHLAVVVLGDAFWQVGDAGGNVRCYDMGEDDWFKVSWPDGDAGASVIAGLVHNEEWMAAAGSQNDGSGAVWIWSQPAPQVWSCPEPECEPIVYLPAWNENVLLVPCADRVYSLGVAAETIQTEWTQELPGRVAGHLTLVPRKGDRPACVAVITTTERRGQRDCQISLLDTADGSIVWKHEGFPIHSYPKEGPSTDGTRLYVSADDSVLAVDLSDGKISERWNVGAQTWTPVTLTHDAVLVAAGQRVVAIEKKTGRQYELRLGWQQRSDPEAPVVMFSDNWVVLNDSYGIWGWRPGAGSEKRGNR